MTVEEAKEAYREAKEATERAKQKAREAQAHLQICQDSERESWVALQDAVLNDKIAVTLDLTPKRIGVKGG